MYSCNSDKTGKSGIYKRYSSWISTFLWMTIQASTDYNLISGIKRKALTFPNVLLPHFIPLDASDDLFSSWQEDSSEGSNHNAVVETLIQRNRNLSISPGGKQEGVFNRPARSFITEEILEALRKADRKGRDVVVGLSNACCKWGCSKSEISSLCWEST